MYHCVRCVRRNYYKFTTQFYDNCEKKFKILKRIQHVSSCRDQNIFTTRTDLVCVLLSAHFPNGHRWTRLRRRRDGRRAATNLRELHTTSQNMSAVEPRTHSYQLPHIKPNRYIYYNK